MRKLRLNLDVLNVESFDTEVTTNGRGTVYGRIEPVTVGTVRPGTATTDTDTFQTGPTCPECPYTYPRTICRIESLCICQTPTDTNTVAD